MDVSVENYCRMWELQPSGSKIKIHSSILHPVKSSDGKDFLKIFKPSSGELRSTGVLRWYGGHGTATLLKSGDKAQLL
jgi:streptomycin 6-kinase